MSIKKNLMLLKISKIKKNRVLKSNLLLEYQSEAKRTVSVLALSQISKLRNISYVMSVFDAVSYLIILVYQGCFR